MSLLELGNPNAVPMSKAIDQAFQALGRPPLGGRSTDGWSGISGLQRCPYRFWLQNELANYDVVGPQPLEVGSLIHACLAAHYARALPPNYPGWHPVSVSPFDLLEKVEQIGAEVLHVREASRLIEGYVEHWGYEGDLQPLAIEYEAGKPGKHTCRYDMIGDQLGIWNYEHKSASRETADVVDGWFLDGEIIGQKYVWDMENLTALFGRPMAGTRINILFKSTPPRFRRIDVTIANSVVERYARDRKFWGDLREWLYKVNVWPKSLQGCIDRYGRCEFWSHCRDDDNSVVQIKLKGVHN